MAATPPRTLLLIDDEPAQARLVAAIAARAGWRTLRAPDVDHAMAMFEQEPVQAVLIDPQDLYRDYDVTRVKNLGELVDYVQQRR